MQFGGWVLKEPDVSMYHHEDGGRFFENGTHLQKLHRVTSQKTTVLVFTAVRYSDVTKDPSISTSGLVTMLLWSLFVIAIAACTWHILAWTRLP
jgi:hypothetical protein